MNTLIPKVEVPVAASGQWRVEKFAVTPELARLDAIRSRGRSIRPGDYTRLMRGGCVVMSDTPAEMSDHWAAVHKAKGRVHINGLGLGMVLNACLLKPEVEHATVVEKSPDVIAMVAPHYRDKFGDRVTIIEADALEYRPAKGRRLGMVWHDIWDYICADNLEQMKALHRRWGRFTEWQGSWGRELLRP